MSKLKLRQRITIIAGALLISVPTYAQNAPKPPRQDFIFIGGDSANLAAYQAKIQESNISGVQIVYTWRSLEPRQGVYDFSQIESNLSYLSAQHRKLFIQIQDRFFTPNARNIPDYLLREKSYAGGLAAQSDNPGEGLPQASGWVAKQWNPALRERYQKLLQALAQRFDGKIYGINLPETAVDIVEGKNARDFSCKKYFAAEISNMLAARRAFQHSYVVQYVNFFPCEWNNDHGYMEQLFKTASAQQIGLGGPDVVPYRKGQMKNSYPFFAKYHTQLPLVSMAVQSPDYTYINPQTKKHFTHQELADFAHNYLGADIIFWDAEHN